MALSVGDFIEDFTYDKWQSMVQSGHLTSAKVITPEPEKENEAEEAKE